MKKSKKLNYIIITILICIIVFIIPLCITNYYSKIYNKGYLGVTFQTLLDSDMTIEQQTKLTIFRKACDHNLSVLKSGISILFIYFIVLTSIIILLFGIAFKKYNITIFKACLCLYIIFILGILIYIIL